MNNKLRVLKFYEYSVLSPAIQRKYERNLDDSFFTVIILTCLVASCRQKEIRYEYYYDANQIVKSEGEYQGGKLNGLLKIFDEKGKEIEIGEWKNGVRDGLTVKNKSMNPKNFR